MIVIVATDTQLLLSSTCDTNSRTPVIYNTYTLERNQFCLLSLFNSSWLKACIAQCVQSNILSQTQSETRPKTQVCIALGSTSLQEFWQHTIPSQHTEQHTEQHTKTKNTHYLQEQALFDKNYYALLRYDQILQYHLACLPHTLVCLTTLSIAWYYAYRLYYPTGFITADTLAELQQTLCTPEHLQQANTQCSLVYAGVGLAHLARYYSS